VSKGKPKGGDRKRDKNRNQKEGKILQPHEKVVGWRENEPSGGGKRYKEARTLKRWGDS